MNRLTDLSEFEIKLFLQSWATRAANYKLKNWTRTHVKAISILNFNYRARHSSFGFHGPAVDLVRTIVLCVVNLLGFGVCDEPEPS